MIAFYASLAIACACLIPAVSAVTISRGISEEELHSVDECTGYDENSEAHWRYKFAKQGDAMLNPTRKTIYDTMENMGLENSRLSRSTFPIGALVSLSENGGGVLELLRLLKEENYENFHVSVVVNVKIGASAKEIACLNVCLQLLVALDLPRVGVLNKFEAHQVNDKLPFPYHIVTVFGITERLRGTPVILDGLCGSEVGLEGGKQTSKSMREALKILPKISPFNEEGNRAIVISHATPSGRNAKGEWGDFQPFKCHVILSTKFPLTAIAMDKGTPINIICDVIDLNKELGTIQFLSAMKVVLKEMANDVKNLREFFVCRSELGYAIVEVALLLPRGRLLILKLLNQAFALRNFRIRIKYAPPHIKHNLMVKYKVVNLADAHRFPF